MLAPRLPSAVLYVTVLILTHSHALAAEKQQQYNVLYFIVDDLRPEFMAAYGQSQMLTPNVDKLAQSGTVFVNAHCQQAVCGPSRASFMTGRRPHHTMVFDNSANFRTNSARDANGPGSSWVTCPGHFKHSNFTTLGGGKTFHPNHPKDWDGSKSWSSDMPYYPFDYYKQNAAYKGPCPGVGGPVGGGASKIDTWCALDEPDENFYDFGLANNTIERLRYAAPLYKKQGKPFFIQSGFARPHAPWRVPQKVWNLYNTSDIKLAQHKLPPQNMPGIAWKQDGFYNASNGHIFQPQITSPIDDWLARNMRHAYYASVTWTDSQIGRVLDELDALGLADSTIVVLHGDHGWQLGEHNSWHKFTNFELGTRVPLIIRAPFKPSAAGSRVSAFAELIDLYPTLSSLANAPPPQTLDGVDLSPLFDDPTSTTLPSRFTFNKTVAFSQFPHETNYNCTFFRDGQCFGTPALSAGRSQSAGTGTMNMMGFRVREHRWSFCVWVPWDSKTGIASWPKLATSSEIFTELYDHGDDTGEDFDAMDVVNVAYDPANAALVARLFGVAYTFFAKLVPPVLPHAPTPVPSPTPQHVECTAAGGISANDGIACCPKVCTKCGGHGCGSLPGGKDNCCHGEVEQNGRDCKTDAAPCSVRD